MTVEDINPTVKLQITDVTDFLIRHTFQWTTTELKMRSSLLLWEGRTSYSQTRRMVQEQVP